jgi:hypothetical protein
LELYCCPPQPSPQAFSTFTFDATRISALTSYTLTVPALLNGSNSFTADKAHLISAPAPGAVFISPFPSILVDNAGKVGAQFAQSSTKTEWQFNGDTAPLTSFGTFTLKSTSTVFSTINTGTTVPVAGFVRIASVSETAAPEPGALLLFVGGLVFLIAGGRVCRPH